ncbi:MAG: PLP-dependent transferase [Saprospiraceae bacterium]|nr:PLP-dependent transferase [Saprospiraceae bacterium]
MIYIETPANPTNESLIDIRCGKEIAKQFSTQDKEVYLAVDKIPIWSAWQHPLKHGADLVFVFCNKVYRRT